MIRSWVCAALLCSASAVAGQRPFIWNYDTEVVPEGDVELEQWLWAMGRAQDTTGQYPNAGTYYVWWGPVVGIGQHLELALPFEIFDPADEYAQLEFVSVDARWRIRPRIETGGFQGLVRLAYLHSTTAAEDWYSHLQLDLVGSWGERKEPHLALDVQGSLDWNGTRGLTESGYADLGFSWPLANGEFQIGGEFFGQWVHPWVPAWNNAPGFFGPPKFQPFVGPDLAWTHGRFWLTAGVLLGLDPGSLQPRWMPRVVWAVAL